ncbi:MAG TPA: choice-of-anchor tandem repeat GloVer-containing protein, partial [Verrucomicrobiae bacterium]|nr:choice-of-anchor tandem repeat GloVer-containing protein [Verrucomicrobiae bacterium]
MLYALQRAPDGDYPGAALTLGRDGNSYGTTFQGGDANRGTVFRLTLTGVYSSLYSLKGVDGNTPNGLALGNDGNFYGTTVGEPPGGGLNFGSWGTVFRVTTNGDFTTLYRFTGWEDGGWPFAGLTLGRDGNLYGVTSLGGSADHGTVFRVTTSGVLTTLVTFTGDNGSAPTGRLVQGPDGNFYGTTQGGGIHDWGTVFRMTPDGNLTTIYRFTNGIDSSVPYTGLTLGPDGKFYGTTWGQGVNGTLFQITTNGALTTLYTFPTGAGGTAPTAELTLGNDGNLYGTADAWAGDGWGTVFRLTPNGDFSLLYSFTGGADGSGPNGLVQGNDGNFYGTTRDGGPGGGGTIFRLIVPQFTCSFSSVTQLPDGSIALTAIGPADQALSLWASPD